ncbi:MAG: carboxylating nicotinate-nucleotide diphosphorylase [Candidatus Omnitrophica bacterium]|nr:carboxylating nicotinate-nucleotide diphosphorylase [Candidatus Omnitrophota bacterium]
MRIPEKKILPIIKTALKEDIGPGDITSQLTIPAKKAIKALILAKENGMVCGLDVARLVFKAVDRRIHFKPATSDGKKVNKGKILARLEGEARSILKAERVALNFLGRLSGIATLTNKFMQKVRPYSVKIMDTRKTTPGLRLLEKYAVRCGGGFNHRLGLWDQVLVKDNHIKVQSSEFPPTPRLRRTGIVRRKTLTEIIEKIKKKKPKGMKLEVEVKNLREFKQVVSISPDIVMLDNMSIKDIRKAVKLKAQSSKLKGQIPKLEVSGGVNLSNVRRIAATGVEMISVGELTHSAKALDVALYCE